MFPLRHTLRRLPHFSWRSSCSFPTRHDRWGAFLKFSIYFWNGTVILFPPFGPFSMSLVIPRLSSKTENFYNLKLKLRFLPSQAKEEGRRSSSVDPQNVHRIGRQPLHLLIFAHPVAPYILQKKCSMNPSSRIFRHCLASRTGENLQIVFFSTFIIPSSSSVSWSSSAKSLLTRYE